MRVARDVSVRRTVLGVVALIAVIGGLVVLAIATEPWIVAPIVVFGLVASIPRVGQIVLQLVCAAVFAMLALVFAAVVVRIALSWTPLEGRLPIPVGLVFAFIVYALVVLWYLRDDWAWTERFGFTVPSPTWSPLWSGFAAIGLACAVILALPLVIGLTEGDTDDVERGEVLSTLDVLIVSEKPAPGATGDLPTDATLRRLAGPYAHADGFEIRYSIGFRQGAGVYWTATDVDSEARAIEALTKPAAVPVNAPEPATDADRVLLLVVDATPPVIADPAELRNLPAVRGEIGRWRRVARAAVPPGTSTYALLETRRAGRLRDWSTFIRAGTPIRRGDAMSVQALASRSMPDAAVRLALGSPSAEADFTLALRYRPIVLFDSREPVPRPLSIDALFRDRKVEQCFSNEVAGTKCELVTRPRELDNGRSHLDLDLPAEEDLRELARREHREQAGSGGTPAEPQLPAPDIAAPPPLTPPPLVRRADALRLGEGSAIYVHPVSVESERQRLLYLDYWWYLPQNPTGSGAGSFCGPGLVIPGISCFDHESDWEGVTVILDRTRPRQPPRPVAVQYAQHSDIVRYEWAALRAAWARRDDTAAIVQESREGRLRPLVFVARGTHASYPMPCGGGCRQVASDVEEARHNGRLPWVGNSAPACGDETCVNMLPTTAGGSAPALWNAFEGPWGQRNCFLRYYCDSTSPPAAPGQQARYEDPREHDGTHEPDS